MVRGSQGCSGGASRVDWRVPKMLWVIPTPPNPLEGPKPPSPLGRSPTGRARSAFSPRSCWRTITRLSGTLATRAGSWPSAAGAAPAAAPAAARTSEKLISSNASPGALCPSRTPSDIATSSSWAPHRPLAAPAAPAGPAPKNPPCKIPNFPRSGAVPALGARVCPVFVSTVRVWSVPRVWGWWGSGFWVLGAPFGEGR